jgi:hypothetical protein
MVDAACPLVRSLQSRIDRLHADLAGPTVPLKDVDEPELLDRGFGEPRAVSELVGVQLATDPAVPLLAGIVRKRRKRLLAPGARP